MNKYSYIDTHAHLDMSQYDEDREEIIKNLKKEEIAVITIGTDKKSSFEAVKLADNYENVFATIGYHPTDSKEEFREDDFAELVQNKKVVGVGECGLDFFRLKGDLPNRQTGFEIEFKKQKENFRKQIDFAVKHDLPIVIHCRDAHLEVIEILKVKKVEYGDKLRGTIHFFSGGIEEAKIYLELGFFFSFGGVLTFTHDYEEVLRFIPFGRILAETDAPFVAPVPYRGQRNQPIYVKEVYKKIAELKNIDLEEVRLVLNNNVKDLFKIY